ncbi:ATP-binding protein [Clostridium neuense]|uniref:histidine kinase n=1 Tax=Clostridium neuense TaxID=1728934 RepID=A0ABW8TAQ9_9CLOT
MKIKFPSLKLLLNPIRKLWGIARKSLRLELIFVFVLSFFLSIGIGIIFNTILNSISAKKNASIEYTYGIRKIDDATRRAASKLNDIYSKNSSPSDIQDVMDELYEDSHLNAVITDLQGNVIMDSKPYSILKKINLYDVIKNSTNKFLEEYGVSNYKEKNSSSYNKEFYSFYPVSLKDKKGFLIVNGIPQGVIVYSHSGDGLLSIVTGITSFIFLFLLFTRKKMRYIEEISNGLIEISKGNLHYKVNTKGHDELSKLSTNINYMACEVSSKIEKERKAEKAKNELITNVSHDLRTPLTSIMGYLGLLKNKKYENQAQMEEYLNIAYNKSEKLKILIEDLFEYTKLTNESITLNKECVALNEFIEQLIEEMIPIFDENNLKVIKEICKERLIVDVDTNKILRVFENLLANAIKYSVKPGQINIKLYRENEEAIFCVENAGNHIGNSDLEKIFERFYRIEKSRSTSTGGSGLGLAIAKSIVDLHGGEIYADCKKNKISFFVKLKTI